MFRELIKSSFITTWGVNAGALRHALIARVISAAPRLRQSTAYRLLKRSQSRYYVLTVGERDRYIDFDIRLAFTFADGRHYRYSKLYYCSERGQDFDESRVICFQPYHRNAFERIRVALPEEARVSGYLAVRIDGLPACRGKFSVRRVLTVSGEADGALTARAEWHRNRQRVRRQVEESERLGRGHLPHYPESLSLELTPRCNLQCPHCSSHGTPELHGIHNRRPEITPAMFDSIACELFPHITTLSLVGRGEPTLVSDALWQRVAASIKHYGVQLSCVTNGHFIRQRFTDDLLPHVDELCISMDGNSQSVHGYNRGGSSLAKVLDNIAWFNEARQQTQVARRPKLSFYWTLMANNIHELPGFVREAARFEPDFFAIRHLVVFHDKDRSQSLVGKPGQVNRFLDEAYRELEARGIAFEAPPLMEVSRNTSALPDNIIAREHLDEGEKTPEKFAELGSDYRAEPCTWMHRTGIISYNGEVTTCGKHYGERVGKLGDETPFDAVWNGAAMQSLRETFNTPQIWQQCRECWLRELRWHSQRRDKDSATGFDRDRRAVFTPAAWDYRDYSDL